MMERETIELTVTKSHKQRLEEMEELLENEDVDVRQQLAEVVQQSIDDTYRQL